MKLIVPVIFAACFFLSCKKEPPVLPEITTSGENTFSCELNGEVFIPKRKGYYLAVEYRSYSKNIGRIRFYTHNADDFEHRTYVVFCADSVYSEGVKTSYNLEYTWVQSDHVYELDTSANNWFEILRYDTTAAIMSGIFEMTLKDDNSGSIMEVTNGRFDYHVIMQ